MCSTFNEAANGALLEAMDVTTPASATALEVEGGEYRSRERKG